MLRSLRYLFRLAGAFLLRFRGVLFLGIFVGIAFFILVRLLGISGSPKNIERIGIVGKYTTSNLPAFILRMVSSGLTKASENGLPQPDIASSWKTDDRGKTWVFYLQEGAKWQDGKEITSANINFNFSDVEIEKPDSQTLVFKLKSPFAPFPSVVSRPIFKKGFLGNGEWKVTKVSISGGYVQKIILLNSKKDRITYKFYPTEERAKIGFKLGEVDKLVDIFNPAPLDSWKTNLVAKETDQTKVVALFFNTGPVNKLLGEKSFRQALAYAINKEGFVYPRAIGPLSPFSWAYNPQVKPYNFSPGKARETIEDLPKEVRSNLSIRLVTTPVLLNQAEKVAQDWGAVGIKTILQVSSALPTEYEALLAVFDIPKDPDQYSFWHSSQITSNITNYNNPRIDKLLEDGRTELDQEARRKIYLDFQRFLVEDSPAIFLYHPISYTIERK